MSLKDNLNNVLPDIPENVKLIAVSKTKPTEDILELHAAGQRSFGENKVQDLAKKYDELPKDIEWHMIGHLQSNKVKYIAPFVSLIHAIDSLKLLQVVDKEAKKNERIINCLLQLHIANETTKFGFELDELKSVLKDFDVKSLANVKIVGLMAMSTFTDDMEQVRSEFKYLKECFTELKNEYFYDQNDFSQISMGMTNDFKIAIEEGSTMVRIGTLIFGERNYH